MAGTYQAILKKRCLRWFISHLITSPDLPLTNVKPNTNNQNIDDGEGYIQINADNINTLFPVIFD